MRQRFIHLLLLLAAPALLAVAMLGFRPVPALTRVTAYLVPNRDSIRAQHAAGKLTGGISAPGLVVFNRDGRAVLQALSSSERQALSGTLALLDPLFNAPPLASALTRQNLTAHLEAGSAPGAGLGTLPSADLTIVSLRPTEAGMAPPDGMGLASDAMAPIRSFQEQVDRAMAALAERHPNRSILHIDAVLDIARLQARDPNLKVQTRVN